MPRLPDLAGGFKMLREVDLNTIRNQAEEPFRIAVTGDTGVGKSTLINQLLSGPGTPEPPLFGYITEHQLNQETLVPPYGLVILLLDASQPSHLSERSVLEKLGSSQVPVVICYNKIDLLRDTWTLPNEFVHRPGNEVIAFSANDRESVSQKLVPVMMRLYKGREIVLARHLPMLREPVSRKLIEDTCFINAAYSLASGLAEMNIVFTIPINVADMVVLTKNQALMTYKIALAFDLPSDWRQTFPKIIAVVGAGFFWRTLARQLVGLIPVVGIIPQVAVAYAGTYAIGQALYRWCANNEKVNPETFKALYSQALARGREVARSMVSRRRNDRQDNAAANPEPG